MGQVHREPWIVCGRALGYASGWDMIENMMITLYDFKPSPGVHVPEGDVTIDFVEGTLTQFDIVGNVTFEGDLVAALVAAPVSSAVVLPS
jgi:hypothetical protein